MIQDHADGSDGAGLKSALSTTKSFQDWHGDGERSCSLQSNAVQEQGVTKIRVGIQIQQQHATYEQIRRA